MTDFINHIISWLYTHRIWGPRCDEFEPACWVCNAWAKHDEWFNK